MTQDIKPGEVERLIERLGKRTKPNPFRAGDRLLPDVVDPLCDEAATVLRALSTQLAERDRQLAEAREIIADVVSSCIGPQVGGSDGGTHIVQPPRHGVLTRASAFLASKEQSDAPH